MKAKVRVALCAAVAGTVLLSPAAGWAQSIETIPLPAGAQVLRASTPTIKAGGVSGSDLFIPRSGTFSVDFVIPAGKQITIGMFTQAQYHQLSIGKKLEGAPLMRQVVTGSGTRSVQVPRGNFFVAFVNNGSTEATFAYRASFK